MKPVKVRKRTTYHELVFKTNKDLSIPRNRGSKLRILKKFFDMKDAMIRCDRTECVSTAGFHVNQRKFYAALYDVHNENRKTTIGEPLPQLALKRILYPHQLLALQWMINQERQPPYYENAFVQVHLKQFPKKYLYFNPHSFQLSDKLPTPARVLPGGILGINDEIIQILIRRFFYFNALADGIGLGKTITVIALILSHQKNKRKHDDLEVKSCNYGAYTSTESIA